jgi:hypothetical protein
MLGAQQCKKPRSRNRERGFLFTKKWETGRYRYILDIEFQLTQKRR